MADDRLKSLRVLMIVPSYPTVAQPAAGIFFRDQALALSEQGMEVCVLAPRPVPRHASRWLTYLNTRTDLADGPLVVKRLRYWDWSRLIHSDHRSATRAVRRWALRSGILEDPPDLIHAHVAVPTGILGRSLSRELGVPLIVTEHSTGFERGIYSETDLQAAATVFNEASAVIVVSDHLRRAVEAACGVDLRRAATIPNVLAAEFMEEPPTRCPDRATFAFLNVAALVPKKRHDLLVEAFAVAFRGSDSVQLRIGGIGPERERVHRIARYRGIEDQVVFLGSLDRRSVVREMQRCSAFVLSSDTETFGVVAIEALSQGKPVLSTRSGGPGEIVSGANGILVAPGSVGALASGLAELHRDSDRFSATEIRTDCIGRYGPEVIGGRIVEQYRRILN